MSEEMTDKEKKEAKAAKAKATKAAKAKQASVTQKARLHGQLTDPVKLRYNGGTSSTGDPIPAVLKAKMGNVPFRIKKGELSDRTFTRREAMSVLKHTRLFGFVADISVVELVPEG